MSLESWSHVLSQRPFSHKAGYMVAVAVVQVAVIHLSPSLYLSQFLLVVTSLLGGMIEPKKGFWLALMQIGILWIGHRVYVRFDWPQTVPSETTFATYTGWFSTLTGSALGSFIRRL